MYYEPRHNNSLVIPGIPQKPTLRTHHTSPVSFITHDLAQTIGSPMPE